MEGNRRDGSLDGTIALMSDRTIALMSDRTIALMSDRYTFIFSRCKRLDTDVFETRLMLRPVICTVGEETVRMFYHPGRFMRKKAMPPKALKLLQD